jgi:glyoxylase-like metal-dependent hydrolase (beta-lactamase superfamily II)
MTRPREIAPGLHYMPLSVGQAHLWMDDEGATLIDTGGPGSLPEIQAAFRQLGISADGLRRIVLTHGHGSNAGATAELARWAGAAEVIAHCDDSAVIRGDYSSPRPRLDGPNTWLTAELIAALASYPAAPVHTEVNHLDVVDFGGGAVIYHTPGHTAGSITIHLPEHRVAFTGGAIVRTAQAITIGGATVDSDVALASFARIALLEPDIVCFGLGPPIVANAGEKLLAALDGLERPVTGSSEGESGKGLCAW